MRETVVYKGELSVMGDVISQDSLTIFKTYTIESVHRTYDGFGYLAVSNDYGAVNYYNEVLFMMGVELREWKINNILE